MNDIGKDDRQNEVSDTARTVSFLHTDGNAFQDVLILQWDMQTDFLHCLRNGKERTEVVSACNSSRESVLSRYIYPEDAAVIAEIERNIRGGVLYTAAEFRVISQEKEYIWCRLHAVTRYDSGRKPAGAMGFLFNVQREKLTLEKLRRRAEKDALTGAFNREETETRIREYLRAEPAGMSS